MPTTTDIRPIPVATSVLYVKTADCLTISIGNKIFFVNDRDGKLTETLKNGIGQASEFLVGDTLCLSQLQSALKLSEHQDFVNYNGKLFFASMEGLVEIEIELADRLIDLKDAGLPYYPLLKFWAKFVTSAAYVNSDSATRTELFARVGTPAFPLTWDGCLIAYFRAHQQDLTENLVVDPNGGGLSFRSLDLAKMFDLTSGTKGRQFDCKHEPLFSLENIKSVCMDRGGIYEVELNPANIERFRFGTHQESLYAGICTLVRSLGLSSTEQNPGFIDMPVSHCADGLSLRDPSSGEATAAYLAELVGSDDRQLGRLENQTASLSPVAISGC